MSGAVERLEGTEHSPMAREYCRDDPEAEGDSLEVTEDEYQTPDDSVHGDCGDIPHRAQYITDKKIIEAADLHLVARRGPQVDTLLYYLVFPRNHAGILKFILVINGLETIIQCKFSQFYFVFCATNSELPHSHYR